MGLFNSVGQVFSNPTNLLAIATMNPAMIAATIGRQLVSQMGQSIIQQLGTTLGMPQPIIDMAQAQFAGTMGDTAGVASNLREAQQGIQSTLGDLFQATNASPTQRGEMERVVQQLLDDVVNVGREGGEEAKAKGGKAGAESFFVAFAKALGKTMDGKMDRMMEVAGKIDDATQSSNASGGKKQAVVGELSAELQGLSQELKLVSEALSTSVKSMGDAASSTARKN